MGEFKSGPIDPARCKEAVYSGDIWSGYVPCSRKVWKDGYCKQHHPDTVAERKRKADEKWRLAQENSPYTRLEKAIARVKQLEAERDLLREENEKLNIHIERMAWALGRISIHSQTALLVYRTAYPKEATDERT